MDSPGGMVSHHEVRRITGKISWVASFLPQLKPFVRQLWACLYTSGTGDTVKWVFKKQVWPVTDVVKNVPQGHVKENWYGIFSWWTVCWMALFWRLTQARREVVLLVGMVIEGGHVLHHQTPLSEQFGQ